MRREHVRLPRPHRAAEAAPKAPARPEPAAPARSDPVPSAAAEAGHTFGSLAVEGSPEATPDLATAEGGGGLHTGLRRRLEHGLGADLSGVRVHRGPLAERVTSLADAPALTSGRNIFLGAMPAAREPGVLAHEAVHVVQQEGGIASTNGASLGARTDPAEREADLAAAALVRGAAVVPPVTRGRAYGVARRFGAGKYGHGGIEGDAATAGAPALSPADQAKRDQGVKQMYSGNFMRDMNQLNVPVVINGLSGLPKDVSNPKGPKIGTKGAHDITTAVIEALGYLELGIDKNVTSLVTGGEVNAQGQKTDDRIGVYRPEEHIDNPMGMSAKGDTLVSNTNPSAVDENKTKIAIGAPRPAGDVVTAEGKPAPADPDRDAQLKGSAVKGNQVENPDLYKISGAGLQNHIFNSVEATKKRWLKAAQLGPTPLGRSEFGAGLHAVEDYFSHSNFIEVALNSYIGDALRNRNKDKTATKFADTVVKQNAPAIGADRVKEGFYVDTLFDAKVGDPKDKRKKRQAITTGSFGSTDTKVSIAHILLPQLPKLQRALLQAVDMLFGIAAGPGGDGGWAHLKKFLDTEPAGKAGTRILEGFSSAGMVAPVPDIELEWKELDLAPAGMTAGLVGLMQPQAAALAVRVPVGIKHLTHSLPLTDAVATYGSIYHRAKAMIDLVQKYDAYIKALVPYPIANLIDTIEKWITKLDQDVRKEVKGMVVGGLVAIVDTISGRKPEEKAKAKAQRKPASPAKPDEEFEKDLGDALEYLHEGVEAMEHTTSLEARLKNGDLSQLPKAEVESRVGPVDVVEDKSQVVGKDPVTGQKIYRHYYVSKKPLPPSHSEISKDHEPHADHPSTLDRHHDEGDKEGLEKGSPFFGLAKSLAVDAVKHCDAQLQAVWSKSAGAGDKSLFGDNRKYEYKSGSDPDQSGKIHDDVLSEAKKRTEAEKKRALREGTAFMGADPKSPEAEALKDPEVAKLISLVDHFISHPDDTSWWRRVMTAYIASDPASVYDSILRRNRTRGERNLK